MDYVSILNFLGNTIYPMQGFGALYGAFCVILIIRRIAQKRFSSERAARQFLDDVQEKLARKDFQAVADTCDSPPYWSKAVPQLILVALHRRDLPLPKLTQLLADRFDREVIADFQYRTSWISTVVKAEPMLGLLGTVVGMISAFAKIAAVQQSGTDPKLLANDISFALYTTAVGLFIAIPLVLAGNAIQIRIGKLQDQVEQHLHEFLTAYDAALTAAGVRRS